MAGACSSQPVDRPATVAGDEVGMAGSAPRQRVVPVVARHHGGGQAGVAQGVRRLDDQPERVARPRHQRVGGDHRRAGRSGVRRSAPSRPGRAGRCPAPARSAAAGAPGRRTGSGRRRSGWATARAASRGSAAAPRPRRYGRTSGRPRCSSARNPPPTSVTTAVDGPCSSRCSAPPALMPDQCRACGHRTSTTVACPRSSIRTVATPPSSASVRSSSAARCWSANHDPMPQSVSQPRSSQAR